MLGNKAGVGGGDKPEVSVLESEKAVREFIEKIVAGICSSAKHEDVSGDKVKEFFGRFDKKDSYSTYMPDISDMYAKTPGDYANANIQKILGLLTDYEKNISVRSSRANPHKEALENFISDVKLGINKLEGIAQDGKSQDYDADNPPELSTFLKTFNAHVSGAVEKSINTVTDTPQKPKKEKFKEKTKSKLPLKMQDEGAKTEPSIQLEFDKLKKEKAAVDEQVRELQKKIKLLESFSEAHTVQMASVKRDHEKEAGNLKKEIITLKEKVGVPKDGEGEIGQLKKALEDQSEASKKKIEELDEKLAELRNSLEQEQKSHNELKESEKSLRESTGKEVAALKSNLEQATKSNTELNSANEKLKSEKEQVDKLVLSNKEEFETKLAAKEQEVTKAAEKLKVANEELEALKTPKPEDVAKSEAKKANLDKLKFTHNVFSNGTAALAFGTLAMYLPGLIEKGVTRFGFERITPDMLHSTTGWMASNAAVPALLGVAFLAGEKRPYAFTMLTLFTSAVECYTSGGDKASILMLTGAAFLMFGEWSSRVNEVREITLRA